MKKEDNEKLSKVDISVKYICNQLTDPFFVSDANFNIIYANDSFKKMIGKNPIGKKCYKLIHELDKFVKGGAYETAVKTKKAAIIELFEPRLKKWIMIIATPVPKKGKLVVCTQHIKDITERKGKEKGIQMLSSMVKQTTEGAAVADLKGNLLFCNEAWSRMHGYKSPEELLGKSLAIFHNKEQLEKEVKPFNKKVIELGNFSGEVGHIKKDGKPFPTLMAVSLLKNDKGKPYAIAGIAKDITERKKAEALLSASEFRYRRLFESAKDGILILDAKTGMIIDVNPFLIDLLGFSHKQFLAKKVWEIGLFNDIVANKAQFINLQKKGYVRYENLPLKTTKGKQINVEFVSNTYYVDNRQVIQCNIRNITERKKSEELLRESEEKFKTLFESSIDGILVADIKTRKFTFANPAICKITGYSAEQLLKVGVNEIHPKKDLPYVLDSFTKLAGKEIELAKDIPVLRKDGKVVYCDINSTPIMLSNKNVLVGFFRDITERKKAEEELRKNEEKYRLLIENLPQKIFFKDRKSVYIYCNENYARDLKINAKDIAGKNDFEFFPKEIAEKYRNDDKRIMDTGKMEDIKEKYLQGRQEMWVHTVKVPLKSESGEVTGIMGLFWDITPDKTAEEIQNKYTKELETFKSFAVNRELKMVELKNRIKQLEQKAKQ